MRQDELDEEENPSPKELKRAVDECLPEKRRVSGNIYRCVGEFDAMFEEGSMTLAENVDAKVESEGKSEDSAEGCWKGSQLFVKVKLCLPYYHLTTHVAG